MFVRRIGQPQEDVGAGRLESLEDGREVLDAERIASGVDDLEPGVLQRAVRLECISMPKRFVDVGDADLGHLPLSLQLLRKPVEGAHAGVGLLQDGVEVREDSSLSLLELTVGPIIG